MIRGIGTDIIEIHRIEKAVQSNPRFLEKIFTKVEINYFTQRKMKTETIAGNFAAKEAVSKALGSGIGQIGFQDIEILHKESGQPIVELSEKAKKFLYKEMLSDENIMKEKQICVMLSISHCKEYATATAIVILI